MIRNFFCMVLGAALLVRIDLSRCSQEQRDRAVDYCIETAGLYTDRVFK